jgi:formylglycine-generating enzyme required for sulfatase activity
MVRSFFFVSISTMTILLLALNSTFAQCGPDKKRPCRKRSKKTSSKPAKPTKSNFLPSSPKIEMVKIPAGTFSMGSDKFGVDEQPVHRVKIDYDFYLGKYEVTQSQWKAVMGNNPSGFKKCGAACPVERVSWNEVKEFIGKLNNLQNEFEYRLPSEAEWEYAARAGTTEDYYDDLDLIAWYDQNSRHKTHPVGQKKPNNFGLYDMTGNVLEWCEDIYQEHYLNLPADGSVNNDKGDKKFRIVRGGSWVLSKFDLRSAYRAGGGLTVHLDVIGFRLAGSLK